MHVELRHWLTPDVDVLNLLRRNVLALRQLKDVLLPVDDLQGAVLQEVRRRRLHVNILRLTHSTRSRQLELPLLTGNHLPMSPV